MLTLQRPIICYDLETTGIAPATDRIWQIGLVKIYPDGTETEWESLINPGVPIPVEVSQATSNEQFPLGIRDTDLQGAPSFKDVAPVLAKGFEGCDLAGFNVRHFDIPLLETEFRRAGVPVSFADRKVVDAFKLYMKIRPRNLTAFVQDMLGEDFSGQAHSALPDAKATWRALKALLQRHPEVPRTPEELHELLFGQDGDSLAGGRFYFLNGKPVINFGKHKGIPIDRVPKQYLEWVCGAEFDPEVKKICRDALQGVYPERRP